MTLGRKMAYQTGAMIIGLLMISAASLWGINGLSTDYGVAMEAYQELRHVYEIKSYTEAASSFLTAPDPPPGRGDDRREKAGKALLDATRELGAYTGREPFAGSIRASARPEIRPATKDPYAADPHRFQKDAVEARLGGALGQLRDSAGNPAHRGRADAPAAIPR